MKAALTTWFIEARAIPISGPVLEEKAKDLAQALQQPDFNATSGWLSRWKTRNNSLQTTSRRERHRSYCSWRLGYQRPARPTNHKTYTMLMRRVSTTELYLMSHLQKRLNNSVVVNKQKIVLHISYKTTNNIRKLYFSSYCTAISWYLIQLLMNYFK